MKQVDDLFRYEEKLTEISRPIEYDEFNYDVIEDIRGRFKSYMEQLKESGEIDDYKLRVAHQLPDDVNVGVTPIRGKVDIMICFKMYNTDYEWYNCILFGNKHPLEMISDGGVRV